MQDFQSNVSANLDVDFITSGSCADVSGHLSNCILDVKTIKLEQPAKQLSVTSLFRFVKDSAIVLSSNFSKLSVFDSLKSKSLRNFVT